MKLKNQQEDFKLLEKKLLMKGLLPEQIGEQPFFSFMEALTAREREDRAELIDPLDAIKQTYGI